MSVKPRNISERERDTMIAARHAAGLRGERNGKPQQTESDREAGLGT